MKYFLLVLASLVISAAGYAAIRLEEGERKAEAEKTDIPTGPDDAPPETEEGEAAEDQAPAEGYTGNEAWVLRAPGMTVYAVFMFVLNAGMAVFRPWYYGLSALPILNYLLIAEVLWICAWTDLKAFRIPNRVLLAGFLLRLVTFAVQLLTHPIGFWQVLLRCGVAAIALMVVALLCRAIAPKSIGFGDIKLLMLMGLYLGTDSVWGVMFCCMAAAFVTSVVLLIAKKVERQSELPFAPFLLAGTVLAAFLTNF